MGREQELELARRAELVEVAQAPRQACALLRQRLDVALQIDARDLELLAEVPALLIEHAQAAPRGAELRLGAPQLGERLVLLTLEPGRRLALGAGLAVHLLERAALRHLEAVLRVRGQRRCDQQAEQPHPQQALHGPTERSTLDSASVAASHASATAAPTNATIHIHGRNTTPTRLKASARWMA